MTRLNRTLFKTVLLGLFIFIMQIYTSCGQTNSISKHDKIDELVSLYSDYEGFNGAILVAHEGEIIYKKGFGLANMEWDIPNQSNTKFLIASITKQFTAMLIMQLVSEGKLDLHEPIITYLPDYPKKNGEQITIHHLLTHSAGLGRDKKRDGKKYNRPKDMVNQFANASLEFLPGERFLYSNSGYTLLGLIIETVTGKPYEKMLQEYIFVPLNMKNTGFYKHRPLIEQMASGYFKSFGQYFNVDKTDESSAYAAGAIYSTVEDLFLWDQALYNETLLPKKYMDLIFTKHITDSDYGGYYGYGWEIKEKPIGNTTEKVATISHDGVIDGFCALFTRIPSNNTSIILLNNTNRAYLNTITTAVTGILNDKSYDFPKKPTAKLMAKVIQEEGIDKGIQFYMEHKDLSDYYIDETELIVEGYRLLHADKAEDAAKVFKLSIEIYPNKDNPYDSYAEALKTLGRNEEAIKNYKKSLELNPNNNNAIKMLQELGIDGTTSNELLDTDNSWGKEIFTMPLHFAKDIQLEGIEDARFPEGWIKEDSPNFWSYAFAWRVHLNSELTLTELEDYMKKYYDGLMSDVNKDKDLMPPKTTTTFRKKEDGTFSGEVTIYDAFATKKPLNLYVRVNQEFCDQKNNSIILFRISPKPFDADIWSKLSAIKILESACD